MRDDFKERDVKSQFVRVPKKSISTNTVIFDKEHMFNIDVNDMNYLDLLDQDIIFRLFSADTTVVLDVYQANVSLRQLNFQKVSSVGEGVFPLKSILSEGFVRSPFYVPM